MNPAERILRVLASHLEGPAHIRLLGGAALILGYGLSRNTEDADLLLDDAESDLLIEQANFGAALEATNRELEPEGLYLTHIWGPEQQILTPGWRQACRPLQRDWGSPWLSVSVLGPTDLVLSKLCRADDEDMADIRWIVTRERLGIEQVEASLAQALVPEVFAEVFPVNRERLLAAMQGW